MKDRKKALKSKKKVLEINKKSENILQKIFKVNGKFDFVGLLKNLAISLGGALVVSLLTKNSMIIFQSLVKPSFTPPSWVFPAVWSVLYILMGIAAYRIYMNNKCGKQDGDAYFYYLIQLLVNFLWSIIFFNFRLYGIGFILAIVLLVLIIVTTLKFFRVDKVAGYLMIPYIFWVSYASVLAFFIWLLNEM